VPAGIVEESITDATEVDQSAVVKEEKIVKTETSFDRSIAPEMGQDPVVSLPEVWTSVADNGIRIWGIEQNELPLIQYNIVLDGGHILSSKEKAGIASFLASMLKEGTESKTPEELEEAIDMLGANISFRSATESMSININCLTRNYEKTLALVEEILLKPRWDEEQFELIKLRMINSIKRNQARPDFIAAKTFRELVYDTESILSVSGNGTIESIKSITIEDLKDFYRKSFSPSVARMHVVGKIGKERVIEGLKSLTTNWQPFDVVIPEIKAPEQPEKSAIYFVDVPGAKQSVISIGNYALPRSDKDFHPATVVNYKLGGSFNGIVNLILREEKGFTYGAHTGFSGGKNYGIFNASSSVRSSATLESVQIFKTEMEKYIQGIDNDGITFTKDALLKSNARRFETIGALLGMLSKISNYNLPVDYIKQEEAFIRSLTAEQHQKITQKLIDPSKMYYVVVGDAQTQLDALEDVGFGKPMLLN
jgi:zinc protease